MSERLSIELQACDRARNRYRRWHLAACQDLFGRWHARVTFGRIGCEGRTIRHDFVNEEDAAASIRACLRWRPTNRKKVRHSLPRHRGFAKRPPLLRIAGLQARRCSVFAEWES